jgi:hypothetical protein
MSTCGSPLGARNQGSAARWRRLLRVLCGMDFTRDIILLLSPPGSSRLVESVRTTSSGESDRGDYRRHFRPFFLDADLVTPTKYKIYYDLVCWLVIQTTYNYVAQPFLILTIWDSFRLWGRLHVPPPFPKPRLTWSFTCTSGSWFLSYFSTVKAKRGSTLNSREKPGDGTVCPNMVPRRGATQVAVRVRGCISFRRCRIRSRR